MPSPTLILADANVLTMDSDAPTAEAVAFQGGRVLDVGSDRRIRGLAGASTEVREIDGATVLPGFVDCHTHAARLGEMHWRADLSGASEKDHALEQLRARAAKTPQDGWVIGWNWDETQWRSGEPITQADLDDISTEHKVLARRVCGHRSVVNTRALEALPFGDEVEGLEREDGELSGVLSEDAAEQAWEACAPTFETCVKGLREESRELAAMGITTVADTAGPRETRLLTRGASEGFVLQRSGLYIRERLLEHLETLGLGPIPSDRCALHGVKIYADGSIGARTAALREPYEDDEDRGRLLRDAEQVAATARRATELGLQLKTHAIGDRAIDAVLDGYEAAELSAEHRPRLEHAEMLNDEHLDRMAEQGVTAVVQPNFVGNWQGEDQLYATALGEERRRAMNPFRSILDAGVPLAFSSDGMPYGPLYGIACATEHPHPKERISVEQALEAYTRGAARALGMEDRLGVLRPGALGDAVVLSEDPRRAADIEAIDVQATVIGGRVVA